MRYLVAFFSMLVLVCEGFSEGVCWQKEADGLYHAYMSKGRGDTGTPIRKAVGFEPRETIGAKSI